MSMKKDFVPRKASFVQAQHSLEAAYAALKRITPADPKRNILTTIQAKIVHARRRVRREYQKACREFENKNRRLARKEAVLNDSK